MIKIAPSILSADFSKLGEEVRKVVDAGADCIHIDVMDGSFVPNITIGAGVVKALRRKSAATFDVHLMVKHPETQIMAFIEAGADIINFHIEAAQYPRQIVREIKSQGCKAGIALNPDTPLTAIEGLLKDVDQALIMTVYPGCGGQPFIPEMLEKIQLLKQLIGQNKLSVEIEVDGGMNSETAKAVIAAGAEILVAGSAIYGAEDLFAAISSLRG